jgi:hypothetical protein
MATKHTDNCAIYTTPDKACDCQPKKLLVYIAGPIANTDDFCERFKQARLEVAQLGYQPVCPVEINGFDNTMRDADNRRAYLQKDIAALMNCDGIYLLRNWENSRGARLEKLIADGLDMIILYQPEQA